jgi:glycine/D-amino acid oxidase-like deaminating enzyme
MGRAATARPLRDLADGRTDEPLADAVFLCPQRDGGVLIGAAMTLSLYDPPEGADLPGRIARRALDAAPGLAGIGVRRAWSGLRPTARDGLPVVGPLDEVDGLYVHGGHASLGMQAAPATAAWLATAIVDPSRPVPGWLRPSRFASPPPPLEEP